LIGRIAGLNSAHGAQLILEQIAGFGNLGPCVIAAVLTLRIAAKRPLEQSFAFGPPK